MDTNASHNSKEVERIQKCAGLLGFYEAFLEAGPQLILQLTNILRFMYICT